MDLAFFHCESKVCLLTTYFPVLATVPYSSHNCFCFICPDRELSEPLVWIFMENKNCLRSGESPVWRGKWLLRVRASIRIKGQRNSWSVVKEESQRKLLILYPWLIWRLWGFGEGPGAGSQALEGTEKASEGLGNWVESATVQKRVGLAGSMGLSAKDTMNRGRGVLFVLSALLAFRFFCLKLKFLVLVECVVDFFCGVMSFVIVSVCTPLPTQPPPLLPHFKSLYNASGELSTKGRGKSRHVILRLCLTLDALQNCCFSLTVIWGVHMWRGFFNDVFP